MTLFELEALGGPWGRRLARRREAYDDLPWEEPLAASASSAASWVWTQSAFSEYASAAAFAEIAAALLAAGAPVDLVAAAGEFVADEMLHAEVSARLAMKLGGATALEVDLTRLVRPPRSTAPMLRAAELVVRTACVGEALTFPLLKLAEATSQEPLVRGVLRRVARDEAFHAELGLWFLDWAGDRLGASDRDYLGSIAREAVSAFAPLLAGSCEASPTSGAPVTARSATAGVLDCRAYDLAFAQALATRVAKPLAARGIVW